MMGFLPAYRAAVEIRKIGDEVVSPDGAGLAAASTLRREPVEDRGSRAATTVMLKTAAAALDPAGIVCDASCKRGSGFPELTRAGRMTDTAIVTAARAAPTNPNARWGVRA
jgi:hypothetical protein